MINTRIVKSIHGKVDLCETYTTNVKMKKLLQVETGNIYFDKVVDVIVGYNADGTPKSKYTYQEIDKTQEDYDRENELKEMELRLGGNK